MIRFGSVSGAVVHWVFITSFGALLVLGMLLELMRRGKPMRRWHAIAGALTLLGFAALGYTGVWRSFYSLEHTDAGLDLTYHWPSRHVLVPWDSIERINTAPGFKGQRPLRLSRCLTGEVARHRGGAAPAVASTDECP